MAQPASSCVGAFDPFAPVDPRVLEGDALGLGKAIQEAKPIRA